MAKHGRLPGLDLLRVAAALSVMAFHLGFWCWSSPVASTRDILGGAVRFPALVPYTWWGWIGVEVFFALSGFVIAFSAAEATARSFLRSRVLRLLPGAIVCATITLGVAAAAGWSPEGGLLTRYVRAALLSPVGPWIDGVYWTLGIEMAFYAVVLAVVAAGRWLAIEAVIACVGAASAAVWLWYFGAVLSGSDAPPSPSARTSELLLMAHGTVFATGVFLWAGTCKGWTFLRRCLFGIFLVLSVLPVVSEASVRGASVGDAAHVAVPVLVWFASVGLLWASVRFDGVFSALPAATIRLIRTAGLATYPLYLLHDVIGVALMRQLAMAGLERHAALVASMIAVIALAAAVTLTLEPALRALIARRLEWIGGRSQAAARRS